MGSEEFIEQLRQQDELREKLYQAMHLPELLQRVEKYYRLQPGQLGRRSKSKEVMMARDLFCHVAVRILKYHGPEVGSYLHSQRSAVSHAVRRGGVIVAESPDIVEELCSKLNV